MTESRDETHGGTQMKNSVTTKEHSSMKTSSSQSNLGNSVAGGKAMKFSQQINSNSNARDSLSKGVHVLSESSTSKSALSAAKFGSDENLAALSKNEMMGISGFQVPSGDSPAGKMSSGGDSRKIVNASIGGNGISSGVHPLYAPSANAPSPPHHHLQGGGSASATSIGNGYKSMVVQGNQHHHQHQHQHHHNHQRNHPIKFNIQSQLIRSELPQAFLYPNLTDRYVSSTHQFGAHE